MALILNLDTVVQSNDNTIIRIKDATGVYGPTNVGGWGTPNDELSTIDGATNSLTLTITVTTSDGTETEYDAIDIYTYLGSAPATYDEILVDVTAAVLSVSGVALGTITDELPDGWYVIEYVLSDIATEAIINSTSVTCLIDGKVRNEIYDMLRAVPTNVYNSIPYRVYTDNWESLTYPLYVLSLFEAMTACVTVSRKNEILSTLNIVERLTI